MARWLDDGWCQLAFFSSLFPRGWSREASPFSRDRSLNSGWLDYGTASESLVGWCTGLNTFIEYALFIALAFMILSRDIYMNPLGGTSYTLPFYSFTHGWMVCSYSIHPGTPFRGGTIINSYLVGFTHTSYPPKELYLLPWNTCIN